MWRFSNVFVLKNYLERSRHVVQWVKDLAVSLLWLWLQLWCGFDPWPRNLHMLEVWKKNYLESFLKMQIRGVPVWLSRNETD